MSFADLVRVRNEERRGRATVVRLSEARLLELTPTGHRFHKHTHAGTDILSKGLLIFDLKERFKSRNPDHASDEIDWVSTVPRRSTFNEGLESVMQNYPQYEWGRRNEAA